MVNPSCEVLVVGAGHAGLEAALAAARMGCDTILVTLSLESIGRMSCNPAMGGIAKGQIVKEIDALGGEMGRATDRAGIWYRVLNRSKGPAVRSPRAQCDKALYSNAMRETALGQSGLRVLEDSVERFRIGGGELRGVTLRRHGGMKAAAVVVTTGTFLRALMHSGEFKNPGGRIGEGASTGLSESLAGLGLTMGRLKTGTPPRLDLESVDWNSLPLQTPDPVPEPFSLLTEAVGPAKIECRLTATNERAHAVVRENLHRAPMYSGQIRARGPRYCPSFEDKVVRFADKPSHQIFLEPEGIGSRSIYCNGISTSLPPDVQEAFVRHIPGLERARFLRYGYAVEYDMVLPHELKQTLETKKIPGLFLAGQINGTSGYEEAGGQGLMAGINAARRARGEEPVILSRSQAYIGVMIDDLTSKSELTEPYRMFTSLAEHRLLLRSDNAFRRLSPIGREIGLASPRLAEVVDRLEEQRNQLLAVLARLGLEREARRPEETLRGLAATHAELRPWVADSRVCELVETELKYEGYLRRQLAQIERLRENDERVLPSTLDYWGVPHLRYEAKEKFSRLRPHTLGQAGRISGIAPADLQVLLVHLASRAEERGPVRS